MNLIKGFVNISQFTNNTPGQISTIGELSTWGLTYAKEKGEYQDIIVPGYELITFKSIDSVSGNSVVVDPVQVRQILQVVRSCVTYASGHIRPYNPIDFNNVLLANFNNRITNLQFGAFVDNGTVEIPQWLIWTSIEGGTNNSIKVWLSDPAFTSQYDDYKIDVIPPIPTLDHFFYGFNVISTELNSRTITQLNDQMQIAKNGYPETVARIYSFDFINPNNPAQVTSTNWAVLIYGQAGDNIDAIKDAITTYVLANSVHTRTEWEALIPTLFKRTEFVLLPRWDKMSVPNLTQLAGLYGSIMKASECITFAQTNVPFYDPAFIANNVSILPFDFKAITVVAINGSDNITGHQLLLEEFPDYIPVPTSSLDFNRMQVYTRTWVLAIQQMLILAETMDINSAIPLQFRRLFRGNTLFISFVYNNVDYLIAAKSNSFYNQ